MQLSFSTERLDIVPLTVDDLDLVVEVFTDPEVRRYTGGPMDESDLRHEMASTVRRGGNGCIGIWCIRSHEGEKLGTLALLPMPVEDHDTDFSLVVDGEWPEADIEIGFYLKRGAWGKGYTTEAACGLIQRVFESGSLDEIAATCEAANAPSRNVLKKLGFRHLGTRRAYGQDAPYFLLRRGDWSGGTSMHDERA